MQSKAAIVTGSTKGIGHAIALRLLKEGFFTVLNYSNDDAAAKELCARLDAHHAGRYAICKADLSCGEGVDTFAAFVERTLGRIDALVLNAGLTDRARLEDITLDAWNRVLFANLSAPLFLVQRFAPRILQDAGRIVFIGSMMGMLPHASSISYGVTKAGVHALAQNLVKSFAPRGITVNAIAPGFIETPWQTEKPAEQRQRIEAKIALRRFGYADEVADLCYSIINNPYINGAVLNIDGGYCYR